VAGAALARSSGGQCGPSPAPSRLRPRSWIPALHQPQLLAPVNFLELAVDAIAGAAFHLLAHDVRLDRQLPSSAVHEDAQRDAARAAEVGELVEGGADRAARVQHVVDDNGVFPGQVAGQVRLPDDRFWADGGE